jgi:thiamine biosynthesis protein ThiS
MIAVTVNGRPESIAEGATLTALLQQLGIQGPFVAVEVNRDVIPRNRHAETRLQAGDRIEIVHFVGGGS